MKVTIQDNCGFYSVCAETDRSEWPIKSVAKITAENQNTKSDAISLVEKEIDELIESLKSLKKKVSSM